MSWIVRKTAGAAAALLLVAGASAQAQTPPAADASAGPPPIDCPKPGAYPLDKSGPQVSKFQKQLDDYKNCVGDYSRVNGAKANALSAESRRYADAANQSIDDFNAYVKGLNLDAK